MPDGWMKLGGEAVAEVLRNLPRTRRLASLFDLGVLGVRPFQLTLNLAYTLLDNVWPLLGCESCGRPKPWVRPIQRLAEWVKAWRNKVPQPLFMPNFKPLAPAAHTRPSSSSDRPEFQ